MKKLCFFLLLLCNASTHAQSNAQASSNTQSSSIGGSGYGGAASAIGHGGAGFGGDSSSISHGGDGGAGGSGGTGAGGIGQGGNGAGGSASSTGQSVHFDQIRQSPSVFMSAPAPTGPCQASRGGFFSFIGGAGLAYSSTLDECEIREESRIAAGIGQPEMAKAILCMAKYASRLEECRKQ